MSWSRTRAALRPARTAALAVAAVLVATTLAACGSDADEQASGSAGTATAGFPVTLKNTFGETTTPEFKGKTITVGSFGPENYVYMPTDPRVQILNELGFVNAAGVDKLQAANTKKEFAVTVSKEKVPDVDADVVVAYVDGLGAQKFTADPVYSSLAAVKRGSAYAMEDQQVISGMSAVSVLSVPWVLDKILPGLSKAAQASD